MSVYLIRNPATGKWLDANTSECEGFENACRRFWSEGAARKCIRGIVRWNKNANAQYASGEWTAWEGFEPYPERYEIVAFRMVEVGVVGSEP